MKMHLLVASNSIHVTSYGRNKNTCDLSHDTGKTSQHLFGLLIDSVGEWRYKVYPRQIRTLN